MASARAFGKMPATYESDDMDFEEELIDRSLQDSEDDDSDRFEEVATPRSSSVNIPMDEDGQSTPGSERTATPHMFNATYAPTTPLLQPQLHHAPLIATSESQSPAFSSAATPGTRSGSLGAIDLPITTLHSPAYISSSSNGSLFRSDNAVPSSSQSAVKRKAVAGINRMTVENAIDWAKDSSARLKEATRQRKDAEIAYNTLSSQAQKLQADNEAGHRTVLDLKAEIQALRKTLAEEKTLKEREATKHEAALDKYKNAYSVYKKHYEKLKKNHETFVEQTESRNNDQDNARATELAALNQTIQQKNVEIAALLNTRQSTQPRLPVPRLSKRRGPATGTHATIGVIPYRPVEPTSSNAHPPSPPLPTADIDESSSTPTTSMPFSEAQITSVIVRVMRDLGVVGANVSTSRCPPRKKRSKMNAPDQAAALGLDTKQANDWKEIVRIFWRDTYGITGYSGWCTYVPVDPLVARRCDEGDEDPGDHNTQLDFSQGFEKSIWNTCILDRYTEAILQQARDESWKLPMADVSLVKTLLINCLRRSREKWWQAQPRFLEDHNPPRYETIDEVASRLDLSDSSRLEALSGRSRRERKLERRQQIVERVLTLKSDLDAPDLGPWVYFKDLLQRLSVDGMSSEEEDQAEIGGVPVSVFKVKLCPWRAPAIKNYLNIIDDAPKNAALEIYHARTTPRLPSNIESTTVKRCLPESLYDAEWLHSTRQRRPRWVEKEL